MRGGVRPEQIAVLSLAGQQRTTLGRLESLGDLVTVRADATDAARRVVVDTFLRFKGLERPWVVVAELGLGAHHYATRMHIALTRATVGCVVVATAAELAADPHLAAAR